MQIKFNYSTKRVIFVSLTQKELKSYILAAPNMYGHNKRLDMYEELISIENDDTKEIYWIRGASNVS